MKRYIYLIAIVLTVISCKKEEPVVPAPVAPAATTTTTGNGNPPAASQKFYVAVQANYNDDHSGAHQTSEVVPDVSINGVPLTYVSFDSGNWVQSNVVDVAFEYDIPASLNLSCEDVIDFVVSFNTDSLNPSDVIQEIQIFHVKPINMVPTWGGPSSWYNVPWTKPPTKDFNYTNVTLRCI